MVTEALMCSEMTVAKITDNLLEADDHGESKLLGAITTDVRTDVAYLMSVVVRGSQYSHGMRGSVV